MDRNTGNNKNDSLNENINDSINDSINGNKNGNKDENRKTISICCGDTEFEFSLGPQDEAWYNLDHRESRNGKEKLVLNADRDVYAVYTDQEGNEHYGTVGDEENRMLADNESVYAGDRFIFYENPAAKEFYV